ncbi:tape measure protein [Caldinitratiruptor microaerophilus]|uniref:Tape measure protein N-terminal domain-containing protein n=1 Tax=Caldinitratiruptor microaerophilus TaxID=671077 RepID=A0AA35CIC2_9FIRM|nr:tape measure protein [Caldinitratiruptor microaerophilus]BDG59640.1 hypothetical protein caldi_07300 [Caldinitratiruptor microaerophilus]
MANIGSLTVAVVAETNAFTAAMKQMQDQVAGVAKAAQSHMGTMQAAIEKAAGPSTALAGWLGKIGALGGAALAGVGVAAVKMAADMEQSRMAFTTLLGSAEAAQSFLKQLSDFAAKTPFELPGLMDASRKLLAFGFDAQSIIPMMTAIGDSVAALGGGAAEIERVTTALGQMQAKGKVSAEEMMQIAELGIPAWEMLAQKIGVSIPEAMKMAQNGAISASTGIQAILQGVNQAFGGAMQQQSQTLLGQWSTAKDNVSSILRTVGDEIIKAFDLGGVLTKLNEQLGALADTISTKGLRGALAEIVPAWLPETITLVGGAIAGALVPGLVKMAVTLFTQTIPALWAAYAPLLPWVLAGTAVAGVALLIYKNWGTISEFFSNVWTAVATKVTDVTGRLNDWLSDTWEKIRTTVSNVWQGIKDFFAKWWDELLVIFTGPIGLLIAMIVKNWDLITAKTKEIWDGIKSWLGGIWDGIKATASSLWNAIHDTIAEPVRRAKESITNAFTAALNWLKDQVKPWLDAGKNLIKALIDGIAGVRIPLPTFEIKWAVGPLGIQIPKLDFGISWRSLRDFIPFLAEGGIVTAPTLAMIGERGPEAVLPLTGAAGGGFIAAIEEAVARGTFEGNRLAGQMNRIGERGQQQEIVIKIDSIVLARALIPALMSEGQRRGVRILLSPREE